MLATAVYDRPFEWEQHLPRLGYAYNTSIHPTTGSSPFSLMFGRQARMPVDIMLGTTTPTPSTVPQYVLNLRNSLETAYEYVRSQMGHKQEQQKHRCDARTHGKAFRVGDQVWLRNPAVPRGSRESSIGPGRVHSRLSESGYRLQHVQAPRKRVVVHFDRLKPCYPGTRQPEMREQCPRRPPQSTPEVPVGTGLELVDEDSGATSPPTFARPEAPSGGESPAPAAPTSPGATAMSPHPSTTPTTSPASSPPSSPLPSTTPITPPLPSPPIEQLRRRYPQRARAPPTRLYGTYTS